MEVTVTNHPDAARYEITVDGEGAGFVTYRQSPGRAEDSARSWCAERWTTPAPTD